MGTIGTVSRPLPAACHGHHRESSVVVAQAFVDKFRYNAKRASLVQSRIKAIERLGTVEVAEEDPEYVCHNFLMHMRPLPSEGDSQSILTCFLMCKTVYDPLQCIISHSLTGCRLQYPTCMVTCYCSVWSCPRAFIYCTVLTHCLFSIVLPWPTSQSSVVSQWPTEWSPSLE
jgi:ABC transporter